MATIDAPIPAIPQVQLPPPGPVNPQAQAQFIAAPTDRWTALKQIGWWKPIDTLLLFILGGHALAGVFAVMFHVATVMGLVIGLLSCCLLLLAWTVMLIYRCMNFVVELRANIEMLPFDAARIAVGFMQGGQKA